MKRKMDDKGVVGFYEDVPALLIVVVATVIFLASIYSAIGRHEQKTSISDFEREALEFADAVRSSPLLLHEGEVGRFDATKIQGLESENLTRSLNYPDFFYRVEITDVSNYSVRYNQTWSREPEHNFTAEDYQEGRKVIYLSVNIVVDTNEVHTARMRVEVWR